MEVGCRTRGGWTTLRSLRKAKTTALVRNATLAEVLEVAELGAAAGLDATQAKSNLRVVRAPVAQSSVRGGLAEGSIHGH